MGDGIKDDSSLDAMIREAMCVVAAERFQLYDEAERHYRHGQEAGRVRFNRTGEVNDVPEHIERVKMGSSWRMHEPGSRLTCTSS